MASIGFDAVIFDLDGTLADTAADLAAALNHSLRSLGRTTIPAESVRNLIGHGTRSLLRRGLAATGDAGEELVDATLPLFLEYYAEHICVGTVPYAGVERALDRLTEEGMPLGICTNKPEALTRLLVSALGWDGRFAAIVGGDTLNSRKPDPEMFHEALARAGGGMGVLVGDSITDADTARAAGVPFVAVSFGFSDRPAIELGADLLIDHYDALVPALRQLSRVACGP